MVNVRQSPSAKRSKLKLIKLKQTTHTTLLTVTNNTQHFYIFKSITVFRLH